MNYFTIVVKTEHSIIIIFPDIKKSVEHRTKLISKKYFGDEIIFDEEIIDYNYLQKNKNSE